MTAPQAATVNRVDTIIIGAGLAGLIAARRLQQRGRTVRVLEARNRLGGRILGATHPTTDSERAPVDLGAQWIGASHRCALELAGELGIRLAPQFRSGMRTLELAGRMYRYRDRFPRINPWVGLELRVALARLGVGARMIDLERPGRGRLAAGWDCISFEQWLARQLYSRRARALLASALSPVIAGPLGSISFLQVLTLIRSAGGIDRAIADTETRTWRLVGGAAQLCERLAGTLGGAITLGEPADEIQQSDERVTVRAGSTEYHAEFAVVAVPPAAAHRLRFRPRLAPARAMIHERTAAGATLVCAVGYRNPFWRRQGFSGEARSDIGPIHRVYDASTPDESDPRMVGFILGEQAAAIGLVPAAERQRLVVQCLVRMFGGEAATPAWYLDADWSSDPWSGGAYVGAMPPGLLGVADDAIREPWGRVRFAGTETALRWCGYLEGAIESGQRVADEILARCTS